MQPIFKETEENGVYTATLFKVMDSGTEIEDRVDLDLKYLREKEIKRCLDLGFDLLVIDTIIKSFLESEKKKAVSDLYKYFAKHEQQRTEYEKSLTV